jgi:hypothetical protein
MKTEEAVTMLARKVTAKVSVIAWVKTTEKTKAMLKVKASP